jgi:hypothetical protein
MAAAPAESEQVRPSFGEREWQIFRGSMSQFNDPVRFVEIFSALRGLRNQEVFDLTNNELKELVKQAINRGLLQRTGRGARAYYRLSSQYRVAQDEVRPQPVATQPSTPAQPAETTDGAQGGDAPVEESAAGLVSDAGLAPSVQRRRRGRTYDALDTRSTPETAPESAPEAAPAEVEASAAAPAAPVEDGAPSVADTVAEQMAVQTAVDPAPAKPRRNRRKKPAAASPEAEPAAAPAQEASAAEPVAEAAETPAAEAEATNGAKKRRSRRKKATPAAEGEAASGETESQ